MARLLPFLIMTSLFAGTSLAGAAENTGTYTCALTRSFECTPDNGCKEWSIMDMALPRFARVDLTAKTIVSLDKDNPRTPTKIASVEKIEGMIVLHGTEQRSWSFAIAEDTGNFSLTAAGDGEVFSVFGACITP